ncbi:LysR family transcriptional regulator [Kitasatospora sp. NPDC094011]|uniref:helix-turn-helix domain-containing protein n=1 Tax=Kitasatospora sp. NPDC094011 TaxID=3364090 RepID=UPI0038079675
MLNSIHIRTLNMVLTTGSFAKAGSMLGYSASAVSQQISALESTTGLTLFERGARSVRPTRAELPRLSWSPRSCDQATCGCCSGLVRYACSYSSGGM